MSELVMPTIEFVMTEEEAAAILLEMRYARVEEIDRMDTAESPTFPFANPPLPPAPFVYWESATILRWLDAVAEEVDDTDHPRDSQSFQAAQPIREYDDDDDVSPLDLSTDTVAESMGWDRVTNPSESDPGLSGTTLVPSASSYMPGTSLTDSTDMQGVDEHPGESHSVSSGSAVRTNESPITSLLRAIESADSMDED